MHSATELNEIIRSCWVQQALSQNVIMVWVGVLLDGGKTGGLVGFRGAQLVITYLEAGQQWSALALCHSMSPVSHYA